MNYNKDRDSYNEAIATGEDLERMLASFDKDYNLYVSNRRFLRFFDLDEKKAVNMLDYIHPEDVGTFKGYVDGGYEEKPDGEVVRINRGDVYHTCLIRFDSHDKHEPGLAQGRFEIVDIVEAVDFYEQSINDLARTRLMLSLTDEIIFTYCKADNQLNLYKYDEIRRVDIYSGDLNEWQSQVLEKELVSGSEVANLNTFVLNMRSYLADFTVKFTSGIFTDGKVLDTRVAVGALYTGTSGDKVMVGRIIKETQNTSVVSDELAGELKIDSLTDVYNKKTITDYAKKRLVEEKENKVIIAILDLDHFKSVNDNYGHMVGDKVLARAGRKLKEVVGSDGVVGRIGGDEFMIVFTGLNDDMTLRAMLRAVRTQIKWEFAEDFEGLSITCSIGASIYPTNGTDYEDLFKKADCCLYIAKEKGRDRYVFFRDELHRAEYEATMNGNAVKAMNSNRDVRELQYVSKFMRMAVESPQAAIKDALLHLMNSFGIDNVTVYYGDKHDRIFSYGTEIAGIQDGSFLHWKEFEKIEGNNANVAYVGHVSYIRSDYPKLSRFLKEAGVTSTIMCAIVEDGKIMGAVTFNKYKNEEAQWANYEIDCAAVFASYVGMLCVGGHQDVLTTADFNTVSKQAV